MKGRRIRRRGSGRSSCDEKDAQAALAAAAPEHSALSGTDVLGGPDSESLAQNSQKRVYEVRARCLHAPSECCQIHIYFSLFLLFSVMTLSLCVAQATLEENGRISDLSRQMVRLQVGILNFCDYKT